MEKRTEAGQDVVDVSGTTITFVNSFYATPSIGISAQGYKQEIIIKLQVNQKLPLQLGFIIVVIQEYQKHLIIKL